MQLFRLYFTKADTDVLSVVSTLALMSSVGPSLKAKKLFL